MTTGNQRPTGGIGAVIIGDEIMLGRREEQHFPRLVALLAARGLRLDWALFLGDDRQRLVDTFRRTLAGDDLVFSFGGIGNTPDDHTRQAVAAAAGVELELHAEAAREIRARFAGTGREMNDEVLGMGRFPSGSRIIPNPCNRIPGFSFAHHHFVPGFPQMAWPMVEWVLDTGYRDRFHREARAEAAIRVWEGVESVLAPLMRRVEVEYPGVKVFSLPSLGSESVGRHVELGVRGLPEQVPAAMALIREQVAALGCRFTPRD
ncbi:MAG: competence/damage-inducible protein A [Betaproteobacteria bacterium HGW-Betaproteobacteria-11]|nr:MAG: competence/damage-inducible protein A [Betaproteobacteria bacterium HGW-Betaproteobacteria-11]